MTSAIFKSTGAIIIYSILTIRILAIAGYNFWGWFGGSKKWKEGHSGAVGGDNQPKEGERCTIAGVEGTYQKYGIDGLQCVPNAEMNQRTMIPDQSFANRATASEPSSERKAINKPKWAFNSISGDSPGMIILNGTSKIPTDFIGGHNIIITNENTLQTLTAQIAQIFPILPNPKNMVSQKVLVKLTGNMAPPITIKGWIEISPYQ